MYIQLYLTTKKPPKTKPEIETCLPMIDGLDYLMELLYQDKEDSDE